MKNSVVRMVLAAMLLGTLGSTPSASAQVDPIEIGVRIGKKLGGGVVNGAKSIGSTVAKILDLSARHEKVTPIVIDGKRAFLLDLYDHEGNRCTLDFDVESRFVGTLYVVGVDADLANRMEFQRKGNKYGSDPNRGPQLRNGSKVDMEWTRNYFCERVVHWTEALDSQYPYGSLLFLEKGLSLDRFFQWLDALP